MYVVMDRSDRIATSKELDFIFDVNVKGVMLCYKHAARVMIEKGTSVGGRLIGASSTAGKKGKHQFLGEKRKQYV